MSHNHLFIITQPPTFALTISINIFQSLFIYPLNLYLTGCNNRAVKSISHHEYSLLPFYQGPSNRKTM